MRRCRRADAADLLCVRRGHGQYPGHTLCRRRRAADPGLPVGAVPGGIGAAERLPSAGAQRHRALCGVGDGGGRMQAAGDGRGLLPSVQQARSGAEMAELRPAAGAGHGGGAVRRGVLFRREYERFPLGADGADHRRRGAGDSPQRGPAHVLSVPAAEPQRLRRRRLCRGEGGQPAAAAGADGRRSVPGGNGDTERL